MPTLNYTQDLAPRVASGHKLRTIRRMRRRPFVVGDDLYHYCGLRTKSVRKLGESKCSKVSEILIARNAVTHEPVVTLNTKQLSESEATVLAIKDGFKCFSEFFDFFEKQKQGLPFHGQLIEWDEIDEHIS